MPLSLEPNAFSARNGNHEDPDFWRSIERIDLRFQQVYLQQIGDSPPDLYPFLLPEKEVALRLRSPHGMPVWRALTGTHLPDTCSILTRRLQDLVRHFDLTPCERDILLAALLPRLSDHYAALPQSGINEGISRQRLTLIFSSTNMEYRLLQSALHPASPLFQFHLLLEEKRGGNKNSAPFYTLNESVWFFFCGLSSSMTYRYPYFRRSETDNSIWYPAQFSEKIYHLCLQQRAEMLPVVVLDGHELDGRERAVANILAAHNRPLLCIDTNGLTSLPKSQQPQRIIEIVRDARLDNAALLLENYVESQTTEPGIMSILEPLLLQVRLPVFVFPNIANEIPIFTNLACVHLSMPTLTTAEKADLLQTAWPVTTDSSIKLELQRLTERYAFSPSNVSLLMKEANYYREIRDEQAPLTAEDLRQTLAYRSRKNFGKLAKRITPVRTFDDIVVSSELKKQLDEILAAIRLRESVTKKHFGHQKREKTGLSVLFYGDSGTGKTLAAEVLAQHLCVDLIKVDLSTVVNKYIGETEKNLGRIFDLAQADSGVLFFDEADALFGKRSETKDAHDRHANIEVSYLLQRLENHPSLVILATNNRNHLDSAFNRRFTFITRFTYPDVSLRTKMWQSIWPSTVKLADDVDFADLAARNELTGANIYNAARLAVVLAAEDASAKIHLHHIEHAVSRELSKLGRLSF